MESGSRRWIALLRAINVGRGRKVEMARLRALLTDELGHRDVRTYVQSGNVVLTAREATTGEQLERELAERIGATFGFEIPVMVRSRDELADVVAANPLRGVADNPARYSVLFLAEAVAPERLSGVDLASFAPETFALLGRELYAWTPAGIHDSPLLKTVGRALAGVSITSRNWRTVERLLAMADEA